MCLYTRKIKSRHVCVCGVCAWCVCVWCVCVCVCGVCVWCVCVWCVWFSLSGLLRRLHGVVVWEYDTIFNTKYFIINSKITALCNCKHSAMLAYIHTSSCRQESDDAVLTHTHTHAYLWSYVAMHKRTRAYYRSSRSATITHTQVAVCWRFDWWWHTHPYPCPRLIACTDSYFSFMFTEAFPLHACGVICSLRTYLTSMRRVFLVETVVLQTVLWDIRA